MSPVRTVWEVRQRTWDRSTDRLLGLFVGDMMADQAIRACYWQVWQAAMATQFVPSIWVPEEARAEFVGSSWDFWFPNDINSETPLFYKVPQQLWDQLPSSVQNFTFTLEDGLSPMVRVQI